MTVKKPHKNPRFEVYKELSEIAPGMNVVHWRWRLIAKNGEIVASGEAHSSRRDALRAVAAVKRAVRAIIA